ncbi:MAG: hypothetical protein R3B70_17275 [Polyangiaceae bacterium]
MAMGALVGASGCDLVSGLSQLKIDEGAGGAGGSGGTGGAGGGTGGTTTGTTDAGGGGTGGVGGSTGGIGGGTTTSPPTCEDGKTNGLETDRDCGGPDCPKCEKDKDCLAASDCVTEICAGEAGATTCVVAMQVAVGNAHVCAVLSNGTLWCWGANDRGQLGAGDGAESASPVQVGLSEVVGVSAGGLPYDKSGGTRARGRPAGRCSAGGPTTRGSSVRGTRTTRRRRRRWSGSAR